MIYTSVDEQSKFSIKLHWPEEVDLVEETTN